MYRSNLARYPRGNVRTNYFALKGGLNLSDSALEIPDGQLLLGVNYEPLPRNGYRRFQGFERFDGRTLPSEATYWILRYDGGTVAISEGDVVTGLTSGASATVLRDQVGTVAEGFIVITALNGEFQDNEDLQVSAATVAIVNGVADIRGAAGNDDRVYAQDAIETQREIIQVVPGSGPVRGVISYRGDTYAIRDNAGATAGVMHKATSAGWVAQDLGNRVEFSAGLTAFVEGDTVTGGTSGATATVTRVVLRAGDWGSGAAGYLILGAITGGPFTATETLTSSGGSATCQANSEANTLPAGGFYEFRIDNFFGTDTTIRLYAVNGVGPAFEWDGSVFVPIFTGNTVDTPFHIEINEFHLMLAFQNGSLQNSATGDPYRWSGGGAAELGMGDEINGLYKEVGQAMIIFCKDRIRQLQGANTAEIPWDLQNVDSNLGAFDRSIQRVAGETRFIDARGFMGLRAAREYGDFAAGTYSQWIQDLVDEARPDFICSSVNRGKSIYRAFYENGFGICAAFNGNELSGFTTYRFQDSDNQPINVRCIDNGESASGIEEIYFGSDDGFVYKMDSGTSFDGAPINALLFLSYTNQNTPSYNKEYKKVVMEVEGEADTQINYNTLYDYGSGKTASGSTIVKTIAAGGFLWDQTLWNSFLWSDEDVGQIEGGLDGIAANISLQISSKNTYVRPHTIYGVTLHYIMRRLVR